MEEGCWERGALAIGKKVWKGDVGRPEKHRGPDVGGVRGGKERATLEAKAGVDRMEDTGSGLCTQAT